MANYQKMMVSIRLNCLMIGLSNILMGIWRFCILPIFSIEEVVEMNMDVSVRRQFYMTAGSAGLKIIPDDKCCRLLAWLYVYGGGNEQVIDGRLSGHIMYAQARLNIDGGEIPDRELAGVMKDYVKSITDYHNPPEWVNELESEYKIRNQHKKLFRGDK
jgi:hypothetical protein